MGNGEVVTIINILQAVSTAHPSLPNVSFECYQIHFHWNSVPAQVCLLVGPPMLDRFYTKRNTLAIQVKAEGRADTITL
jgi:hypothetical protein